MFDENIHIAVIDDGINEKYYNNCRLKYNIEISNELNVIERKIYDKHIYSHGTICAAIIHKYSPEACISSIKILNENGQAEKQKLVRAIEWCIDKRINIINLSLGTSYFYDYEIIFDITKKAIKKGIIIIAASSNSGLITYPAYFTDVISVKCDREDALKNEEYVYNYYPVDGVDITACSNHLIDTTFGGNEYTGVCNSYAAAFITSKVYNILCQNKNINLQNINMELSKGAVNYNSNCPHLINIKKEIDWIDNAIIFKFDKLNTELKYNKFNVIGIVNLEYESEDKLVNDILKYLNSNIDTVIIDANTIEFKDKNYCPNKVLKELCKINKNIVYLDDREINKNILLDLQKNKFKLWHPSIVNHIDLPICEEIDIPVITIHDFTQIRLLNSMYKIQEYFRNDEYNIISVVNKCYGKLLGFEYIPEFNKKMSQRLDVKYLEFITALYNPDIMLIGLNNFDEYINEINNFFEIDISILIIEKFDDQIIQFLKSGRNRKLIVISDEEEIPVLNTNNCIKVFNYSIFNELYKLYEFIICLYNEG